VRKKFSPTDCKLIHGNQTQRCDVTAKLLAAGTLTESNPAQLSLKKKDAEKLDPCRKLCFGMYHPVVRNTLPTFKINITPPFTGLRSRLCLPSVSCLIFAWQHISELLPNYTKYIPEESIFRNQRYDNFKYKTDPFVFIEFLYTSVTA
jgi:hypothetical protein